jgi:hypothetical protein
MVMIERWAMGGKDEKKKKRRRKSMKLAKAC